MMSKVTQINLNRASTNRPLVPLVPRKPMGIEPFSAQQRESILIRFHRLGHSITRIARSEGVGDIAVENVLRFEYWRSNGRRKSDRQERAAA